MHSVSQFPLNGTKNMARRALNTILNENVLHEKLLSPNATERPTDCALHTQRHI